jgi:two-component system, response regulator YesN
MRILIVDDDIPTVDAILASIPWASIGIDEVRTAYGEAPAKHYLQNEKIDIVVSDIEMPRGSGLDLLTWIRQEGIETEFLLLTCHEKFEYAASAIKLDAAEYLTKPFDAQIMELSLKKTIARINENRRLHESSRYGEWRSQNTRQEELHFWLSLYSGIAGRERAQIRREVEARGLPIDTETRFRLVVTKVSDYEQPSHDLGEGLFYYILESIYSRALCSREANARVIHRAGENGLWLLTAVPDAPDAAVRGQCEGAALECVGSAHVKATSCISRAVMIEELPDRPAVLQKLIERNVVFYGQAFTQDEALEIPVEETQVLKIETLEALLLRHDKVTLLNCLKDELGKRMELKTLSEHTLYLIKQELLQAVYSHLLRCGIQATRLFCNEDSVRLSDKACRSSLDTIRFANYLLERTFTYEEEIRRTGTLIERVNNYILAHYRENIGRNEIAAEFHLAPEYLAKLYCKRTGRHMKDTLRKCRIAEAKRLLQDAEALVSDVAGEVGFDNFAYFSTVFKKETGMNPQEYQKGRGLRGTP